MEQREKIKFFTLYEMEPNMFSVNGYYDGQGFITADNVLPKKNQKVIITILNEFEMLDEIATPNPNKPFRKYIGKLSENDTQEILEALSDCEKVDLNEW